MKKRDLSIDDYIFKFWNISNQLFSIGQPIADSDLITHVLAGLGPEYESISVFLQSKCEELSLHEVQFSLQTHELRIQNQASATFGFGDFSQQENVHYFQYH